MYTIIVVPLLSPSCTIRGYGAITVRGSHPHLTALSNAYPVDIILADNAEGMRSYVRAFLEEHDPPWDMRDVRYVSNDSSLLFQSLDEFLYFTSSLRH